MGIINRIVWAGIIAIVLYIIVGLFFTARFGEVFFSPMGFGIALLAMFIEITFVSQ